MKFEKIRKKSTDLDSLSIQDYFLIFKYIKHGRIRYSLLNNKLVEGKSNEVNFMILDRGIMRNTSCENVIELGSMGVKIYFGLLQV